MDTAKRIFDQYGKIMDQEIVAVQLGCYSVALIGLAAAIRNVRPFSRFRRPKDIPKHFIVEKRELTGYVKRIDPNGALLMVEHKPLIPLPLFRKGQLPVKILGVKVSGLGISWLQSIVVNSEVTFIPVIKETDFVHCKVLLPNTNVNVKSSKSGVLKLIRKKEEPFLNVAECLVKVGFAEITPLEQSILKENQYVNYYNLLKTAEIQALKKKLGMRYYVKPSMEILEIGLKKLANNTMVLLTKVIYNIRNLPSKMTVT